MNKQINLLLMVALFLMFGISSAAQASGPVPLNVRAIADQNAEGTIKVSWDACVAKVGKEVLRGYRVYYDAHGKHTGDKYLLFSLRSETTRRVSLSLTGLFGIGYNIWVVAEYSHETIYKSGVVKNVVPLDHTAPAIPTNLSAVTISLHGQMYNTSTVRLTWDNSNKEPDFKFYQIDWNLTNDKVANHATLSPVNCKTTCYYDIQNLRGFEYVFSVKAVDEMGNNNSSSPVLRYTPIDITPPPTPEVCDIYVSGHNANFIDPALFVFTVVLKNTYGYMNPDLKGFRLHYINVNNAGDNGDISVDLQSLSASGKCPAGTTGLDPKASWDWIITESMKFMTIGETYDMYIWAVDQQGNESCGANPVRRRFGI